MALNPQYETIAKAFVQQYYAIFDDPEQRKNLANMYNADTSLMTMEGNILQGSNKIMENINSLGFKKICHVITTIDAQPMLDGSVLIKVLGRLKCDNGLPQTYVQTFILKPLGESFFVQHDIFRLCPK